MLSSKTPSSEELISRLSFRPYDIINRMVSIPDPAKPLAIKRHFSASSIGSLDRLPLELLHWILGLLDAQSVSRVSRVSLRGKAIVESLPAYQCLIGHAPKLLGALGRIQQIKIHSISTLQATLFSERCVSCKHHGAFVFLPTCERCCFGCLHWNPLLWVIPPAEAEIWFDLTTREVKEIPTMKSIPRANSVAHPTSRRTIQEFVSVRAANELSITARRFPEKMLKGMAKVYYSFGWLQGAPLPLPYKGLNSAFWGLASTPCPSISTNRAVEHGLWCRGCERLVKLYLSGRLTSAERAALFPQKPPSLQALVIRRSRSWSRSEFVEHVLHCLGVQKLAPDVGQGPV